ncbi:MAG: hypothetical protein KDB23_31560, partial [Planctomycetales bacterium]|nr:hypothetical protein [Planctomycetales bacterium]
AYMVQSQNKLISSLVAGDETPRDECVLTSIEFSAGATEFQGKPIVSVFVDGDNLASQEIAGIQSTHSDSNGIKDEVLEAAKHVQTYHVDVHNRRMPREVRLKFTNDLWQAGKQNGDRNVILADLTINGHNVPEQQVSVAPDQKVVLASKRAVMYENSEIVYTGPFVAGCSLSAVAAAH